MDSADKQRFIDHVVKLLEQTDIRECSINYGIDEQPPVDFFRQFKQNDTITIQVNGGARDRRMS